MGCSSVWSGIDGGAVAGCGCCDPDIARLRPTREWVSSQHHRLHAGWNYRVMSSVNLKQWGTVATGASAGESVPFADTAQKSGALPARSFRS